MSGTVFKRDVAAFGWHAMNDKWGSRDPESYPCVQIDFWLAALVATVATTVYLYHIHKALTN